MPAQRKHPGRGGAAWERARARVLVRGSSCWLCGRPLDFDAPKRSRWAPSVDHVVSLKAMRCLPLAEQRRLALDPANLRPAHYGCNSARGSKAAAPVRKASRKW